MVVSMLRPKREKDGEERGREERRGGEGERRGGGGEGKRGEEEERGREERRRRGEERKGEGEARRGRRERFITTLQDDCKLVPRPSRSEGRETEIPSTAPPPADATTPPSPPWKHALWQTTPTMMEKNRSVNQLYVDGCCKTFIPFPTNSFPPSSSLLTHPFHPYSCQAVDFHRKLLERGGLNLGRVIFN